MADRVPWRGSQCIIVPNFAAIGRTLAEIWPFFIFQDGGRRHLGFLKRQIFNGRTRQEGQTVAETWPFFDFSRWRPPPSCIFKMWTF